MFIRKNYLFVVILMLCLISAGGFFLAASEGESEGKKGEVEIKWLYPPKYYDGTTFSEGRAWVQEEEDGPWSLLDDQGNVLKTGLKAASVSRYGDGIASLCLPLLHDGDLDPSGQGFLHRSGDVVLSRDLRNSNHGFCSEGLIAGVSEDGLVGFFDLSGKWVISPAYGNTYFFSEGLAPVQKGDKWGFIDKTGAVVIDFKFDKAYWFSHKMAPARGASKWGVIDPTGRWIVEPVYDGIGGRFWSDPIALEKDGKVGFINSKGDVVIDFQYPPEPSLWRRFLYCFHDGRAIVILDDSDEENSLYGIIEFGIIDESGKVLFQRKNCEFFFIEDYILCRNENGRYSLIDRENREYDLPDDFYFLNRWVSPNEKKPYPFVGVSDDKIGYFTISLKRN